MRWTARFVVCGFLTLLLGATGKAQSEPARIEAVFAAKCGNCHGPALAKPKGRFGFVTDLARLAADPEKIVPGQPEASALYKALVDEDAETRMPPAKSKTGPLTAEEIAGVRAWITAGAPSTASGAAATSRTTPPDSASGATAAPAGAAPQRLGALERTLVFIGKTHPAIVHFPIAFLLVAALVEFFARRRKTLPGHAIRRFCSAVGAAGAVVATAIGFLAALDGWSEQTIGLHRYVGLATALTAILTVLNDRRSPRVEGETSTLGRALVVAAAASAAATGFLGGLIVHGPDHYSW